VIIFRIRTFRKNIRLLSNHIYITVVEYYRPKNNNNLHPHEILISVDY